MADNGYTSTDSAVQARIREMQRQAEASAAAQRAQSSGMSYNPADIDPSKNPTNIAAQNAWNVVAANRQAGIEQAAGMNSSVGAGAYTRYGGGSSTSGTQGTSGASTGSTAASTTTAGSGNTRTAITTPSATSTNTSMVSPGYTDSINRPTIDDTTSYYTKPPELPRSISDIRQEQLDQAQKAIDATRGIYEDARQRRQTLGARQLAQTSAQNVGAGLAGSPFALTNETGVNENTQYELNALANQRSADISKIFADAEDRAQQLYQNSLNNYYQERNFYVSERDKAIAEEKARKEATKTAATNMITNIAKGGYSIDEMNPDEYKQLLYNSGMSDFEARAIWAASSPAANAQYSVQNGYLVGTYFDPHTKLPVVTTTKLPDGINPDEVSSQVLGDGSVIFYDKNNPWTTDSDGNRSLKIINYPGSDIKKPTNDGLSDPQKASIFNSIVSKYNSSPLILASDRLPVLQAAIDAIQENPEDAALQLNLSYAYIQALDTYQSSVREGELQNLNSIDSKIGNIGNYIGQIQNGQIVRPEVAQQIAEAARNIVDTIHSAASQKAQSFASQASVAGVGDEWQQYLGGFTQNYAQNAFEAVNTPDNSGIVFNQSYATPDAIVQAYPELQQSIMDLLNAGYNDAEIVQYFNGKYGGGGQSFSNDQSMSLNYSPEAAKNVAGIQKVAMKFPTGEHGGQCGRFVNKHTGFRVGDSYASKMAITDPNIGKPNNPPMPGDVFVFPYKKTGHIGFIESVQRLADGTYKLGVIDSNYHLNEKVDRHYINSKIVTGYARPKQIIV